MSETLWPTVIVDERIELGVTLLWVVSAIALAYYAGGNENWAPLLAIYLGIGLIVLLITSES